MQNPTAASLENETELIGTLRFSFVCSVVLIGFCWICKLCVQVTILLKSKNSMLSLVKLNRVLKP